MAAVDIPAAAGTQRTRTATRDANYLKAKRGHRVVARRRSITSASASCTSRWSPSRSWSGGIFALLVRLELFTRGRTIVDAETYNRFFTLHGAVMVFLFIIPSVPAALGNFFLPIMIGAKDVAVPAAQPAQLLHLPGGRGRSCSRASSWARSTPAGRSTRPTACRPATRVISMTFGVFVLGFSSILTGLNFLVTVHTMRAPGRHLDAAAALRLGHVRHRRSSRCWPRRCSRSRCCCSSSERFFGIGIFDPKLGGDPVLFQHFFWFYSHPAVYIMIVPGMAIDQRAHRHVLAARDLRLLRHRHELPRPRAPRASSCGATTCSWPA